MLGADTLESGDGLLNGGWEGFHALALSNECLHVLEGVVVHSLALLLVSGDELSVAVELGWEWGGVVLDGFHVDWEGLSEDGINLHSVVELLLEGLVVLSGGIRHDLVVEVVELDVSGVDSELVLDVSGWSVLVELHDVLESFLGVLLEHSPEVVLVLSLINVSGLEISNWLIGEGKLSPLKNVGFGGLGLNGIVLGLEGLLVHLGLVGIL